MWSSCRPFGKLFISFLTDSICGMPILNLTLPSLKGLIRLALILSALLPC
uniref:Uncharacterized protein n=1 Tax=uncultured marine virus TaxID=186617 RepID=A0A0F7L4D4_9VIRU|nr:hypothetical protein [uncultured marine virus]